MGHLVGEGTVALTQALVPGGRNDVIQVAGAFRALCWSRAAPPVGVCGSAAGGVQERYFPASGGVLSSLSSARPLELRHPAGCQGVRWLKQKQKEQAQRCPEAGLASTR